VLPLLIVIPIRSLDQQGYFKLKNIQLVLVDQTANKNYYSNLAKQTEQQLNVFLSKSLFEVDLGQMAKMISSEKWIEDFEIQREWPDSIKVKVNANELVMLYWNEKNDIYPIFSNNEMLDKLNKKDLPDAIHTYDKKIANQKELRKKVIDVIQKLPEKGPLSPKMIAEVGFDSKAGYWFQLIKKDLRVKMGEEKMELKSERVSNVIEYLETKQIDARVIDANLSQKVLVRLRKDP
jgi:cell division protein FtsQ